MASSITWYDHAWQLIATKRVGLSIDTLKIALVTSSYTPNIAHTVWDPGTNNAADPSFNEVAAGSGYTAGGMTLASYVVTNSNIDCADPALTALTKTFRYGVCYANLTTCALTDPLLFYILFDTSTADIVMSGSNFSIVINATDKLFYRPV